MPGEFYFPAHRQDFFPLLVADDHFLRPRGCSRISGVIIRDSPREANHTTPT